MLFMVRLAFYSVFFFLVQSSFWHDSAYHVGASKSMQTNPLDTISIIDDPLFQNGLILKRAQKPSPGTLYPFGKADTRDPIWELAEWGSKFKLTGEDKSDADGEVVYTHSGKKIAFDRVDSKTAVSMDVFASEEFASPREQNQAWPHLLIEQAFDEPVPVKNLKELILQFKGCLTRAEMKMEEADFDPGLHTAQFQLFITVQNQNTQSDYYGDFLWFGIPFYDYRQEKVDVYAAQDVGKGDASGKFIYSAANTDFMEGTFHDRQWKSIEKDILPLMVHALDVAKERGYLTGSAFEDFHLSGMNMGWEVPGTFDVGFSFKDFDLLAVTEK